MTQEPYYPAPGDQLPVQPAQQTQQAQQTQPATRQINIGRLWAGGLATAVVTALIVVVGVLVARQLLGTPALSSSSSGRYANGTITTYALLAAAAALLATAVMNLLLLAVPQPARFFSWIAGLVTVAAAILPFTMAGANGTKVASALINLLVGVAILALISSIAAGCVRRSDLRTGAVTPTVL